MSNRVLRVDAPWVERPAKKSDAEQAREDHEAWKAKRDKELADAQAQVQKDAYARIDAERAALAQVQVAAVPTGHVVEKSRLDEAIEKRDREREEQARGGAPPGAAYVRGDATKR